MNDVLCIDDAVGGEAYWAAGASLISAIPGFSHLPIKIHAFANAGSLVTKISKTNELAQTPRASIGLGLILHHSIARIEANYCIPLRYSTSDSPEPKFQFGIGLNFL
jgi:outer membrane protein insertion porin family